MGHSKFQMNLTRGAKVIEKKKNCTVLGLDNSLCRALKIIFGRLTAIKISSTIPTVEFNLHFGILKYLLKP